MLYNLDQKWKDRSGPVKLTYELFGADWDGWEGVAEQCFHVNPKT